MAEILGEAVEFELSDSKVIMVPSEARPVSSVNGMVGDVQLKTSDLPNDSGYITKASYVNVLSLGCDNTGTEDCAEILNAYTGSSPLFFPAGNYLFRSTFKPSVPILGAGYSRNGNVETSNTNFIQGAGVETVVHIDFTRTGIRKNIVVRDINISLNYDGNGLLATLNGQANEVTLDRVSVAGLRNGYGLHFVNAGSKFSTRGVYLSNIFVLGKTCAYNAIGLDVGVNIGDTQMNMLEIMGVRIGLRIHGGFHNIVNTHIWCGVYGSDVPTAANANATRAVMISDRYAVLNFVNLYTDTAQIAIAVNPLDSVIRITNWLHWDDGTLDQYITDPGCLLWTNDLYQGETTITNMTVKIPSWLYQVFAVEANGNVDGAIRLYDANYSTQTRPLLRSVFRQFCRPNKVRYRMPTDAANYVPVLIIFPQDKSFLDFTARTLTGEWDSCHMEFSMTNFVPTVSAATATRSGPGHATANQLYYKVVGSAVLVFTKNNQQSSNWPQEFTVDVTDGQNRISWLAPMEMYPNTSTSMFSALTTQDATGLNVFNYGS